MTPSRAPFLTPPTGERAYAELPLVSEGYPPPRGRLPTRSSPVRHVSAPKGAPSDLHALGAPPALILSQDQTLHQDSAPRFRGPSRFCAAATAGPSPACGRASSVLYRSGARRLPWSGDPTPAPSPARPPLPQDRRPLGPRPAASRATLSRCCSAQAARHRRATKPPRGFGAAEATCPVAFASGPARNVVRTSYTASASCLPLRLVGRIAIAPRDGAAHGSAPEPGLSTAPRPFRPQSPAARSRHRLTAEKTTLSSRARAS